MYFATPKQDNALSYEFAPTSQRAKTTQPSRIFGLIAKVFATSTLAASAAYSARQASKQEAVERYARKLEMELVTIDPFIESLSDDQKSALKVELTRKLFGNPKSMEITSQDESNPELDRIANIESNINSILNIVSK